MSGDNQHTASEQVPIAAEGRRSTDWVVFAVAAVLAGGFLAWGIISTDTLKTASSEVLGWLSKNLGWVFLTAATGFVVFALWLAFSKYGRIPLGRDDEKPEFRTVSWIAMMFSAGMGIGLMFWGAAEPLEFFTNPPPGTVEGGTNEAIEVAMSTALFHWTVHPWSIYAVVGLAIAYSTFRRGRKQLISSAFAPLFGESASETTAGRIIDVLAIFATLFGSAASLGLGTLQIGAGLQAGGWLDAGPGTGLLVAIIAILTIAFVASAVSGVAKGIQWLSNINMVLAALLMLAVLALGPTLFIFKDLVQSIGDYFQNLLRMSFNTTAYEGADGNSWQGWWTTFYWGWWISWAPFVGVFIARISRGRTVREFVAGVLLVPTAVTTLWFTVFGGTALYRELFGEGGLVGTDETGAATVDTEASLFGMLDGLPGGALLSVGALILIVLFFVTSSDSGSLVVDMLASGGNPEPPKWSRVFWCLLGGAVAIALLLAGGLDPIKTVAILIALPFSVVMIGMCVATWKAFRVERQSMLRVQRQLQRERLTEHVTNSLIDEGLVDPADKSGPDTEKVVTKS